MVWKRVAGRFRRRPRVRAGVPDAGTGFGPSAGERNAEEANGGDERRDQHDDQLASIAAALAFVDATLDVVSGRDFLTHDEAVSLLRNVRIHHGESVLGSAGVSVLEEAIAACDGDAVVDRRRVADPLLDVRSSLMRDRGDVTSSR